MKINGGNKGPVRPEAPREVRGTSTDAAAKSRQKATEGSARNDRVEISEAGRAKGARVEPTTPGQADRLQEIRQRILSGAYDADTVVSEVARRILDRGDL